MTIEIYAIVGNSEVCLSNRSLNKEEKKKLTELIATLPKVCTKCKTARKDTLITKCRCMFCKKCLKSSLLEANENLLTGTFETKRVKEAMCTCPVHDWRIEPRFVQSVFTPEELERYIVGTMKREIKDGEKRRNMWANICIECKRVLIDQGRHYRAQCYRHKVCRECFEYSCTHP